MRLLYYAQKTSYMLFLHDCAVYQAKFLFFSSSRQVVKVRPENPVANEKSNLKIIMSFS